MLLGLIGFLVYLITRKKSSGGGGSGGGGSGGGGSTKLTNPVATLRIVGDQYNEYKGDTAYESAKSDCLQENDCE